MTANRYTKLLMCLTALAVTMGAAEAAETPSTFYDARGVIHCHSVYSDGSGTVEQIAEAANAAKLDYLILTDHDKLWALQGGKEGWHGSTLVLVGQETTCPDGHMLTLRVPASFNAKNLTSQQILDLIRKDEGIAIIAHPLNSHIPWKNWNVTGYQGLEIVNLMEMAEDHRAQLEAYAMEMMLTGKIDYQKVFRKALSTYPKMQLERYDQMTAKEKLVMTTGADAHAKVTYNGQTLNIPPYRETFEAAQMHLILPDPLNRDLAHDKKLVYDALAEGHGYVGYDVFGGTSGFRFLAGVNGTTITMGDSVPFAKGIRLVVTPPTEKAIAPESIELDILRNTAVIAKGDGKGVSFEADRPGAYRAEAWIVKGAQRQLWILSNPIYLMRGE